MVRIKSKGVLATWILVLILSAAPLIIILLPKHKTVEQEREARDYYRWREIHRSLSAVVVSFYARHGKMPKSLNELDRPKVLNLDYEGFQEEVFIEKLESLGTVDGVERYSVQLRGQPVFEERIGIPLSRS